MNGNEPSDPEWDLDETVRTVLDYFAGNSVAAVILVIALILLPLVPTMYVQVDRDEEAVVLRFGRESRVLPPGLHGKLPYPIETSHIVNTQKVFSEQFGFRSDQNRNYSNESLMLTGDLGVANVQWVVQYKKSEPTKYLFNIINEREILREASFSAMRRVIGDWNVAEVITEGRGPIANEMRSELQKILDSYSSGMRVDKVAIQQSEPPKPVESAFKKVDSARQRKEELRNEALAQQEKVTNEVDGKVQRMLQVAQGDSAAMINRAEGDAERFERILTQYRRAPEVTEERMYLETMEKVMDDSERVYVIDEKVKGLLPLLNLRNQGANQSP